MNKERKFFISLAISLLSVGLLFPAGAEERYLIISSDKFIGEPSIDAFKSHKIGNDGFSVDVKYTDEIIPPWVFIEEPPFYISKYIRDYKKDHPNFSYLPLLGDTIDL